LLICVSFLGNIFIRKGDAFGKLVWVGTCENIRKFIVEILEAERWVFLYFQDRRTISRRVTVFLREDA